MAGLQSFLRGDNLRSSTPSPRSNQREARHTIARSLKLNLPRGSSPNASYEISNRTPIPTYGPNRFEDSTLGSDYDDDTKIDGCKQNDLHGMDVIGQREQEDDEFESELGHEEDEAIRAEQEQLRVLHHNRPPTATNISQVQSRFRRPQTFGISDRIHSHTQVVHTQLGVNESDDKMRPQGNGSKKRNYTGERLHEIDHQMTSNQSPRDEFLPGTRASALADEVRHARETAATSEYFNASDEDLAISTTGSPNHPALQFLQQETDRDQALNSEYGDETLKRMTYSELKNQQFDTEPPAEQLDIIPELQAPEITLADRIKYHTKTSDAETQVKFYGQMTMTQWEESGDWFLEHFGELLQKLKEARHTKRNLVAGFEREIETWEETIEGRSGRLENEFNEMRVTGEGVLRGKTI